jgi:hypothetical protein
VTGFLPFPFGIPLPIFKNFNELVLLKFLIFLILKVGLGFGSDFLI